MGAIKEFAQSCIDSQSTEDVVDHLLAKCQDDDELMELSDRKLRELMGCLETTLVNRMAREFGGFVDD